MPVNIPWQDQDTLASSYEWEYKEDNLYNLVCFKSNLKLLFKSKEDTNLVNSLHVFERHCPLHQIQQNIKEVACIQCVYVLTTGNCYPKDLKETIKITKGKLNDRNDQMANK